MVRVNEHYLKLKAGYLFPEIARRVTDFQKKNPKAKIIRLGIGDVVLPLPKAVVKAMRSAVGKMGKKETFRGYGPEQGYPFLIEAIIKNDFAPRGVRLSPSEVFISDGSKCDTGNIQEIFSADCRVAVTDPVYPVYVDATVMAGRSGEATSQGTFEKIVYLPATEKNGFCPPLPEGKVDLIYLCAPNNPTGAVLGKEALAAWVNYAQKNAAVIFFDAAYEAYITDKKIPHSIYEIPGADEVAIEFRSFSKTAGFTGTRCACLVIPEKLQGTCPNGDKVSLNSLWRRRHTTKFNGVSYPVQLGAAACYTSEGKSEIRKIISYYLDNAAIIRDGVSKAGLKVYGGVNAPYLWVKTPNGTGSWDFFQKLLQEAHVVGTPGVGFGPSGEGFLRLSSFGFRSNIKEAVARIKALLQA